MLFNDYGFTRTKTRDRVAIRWQDLTCMRSVLVVETKVWVKIPALWEVRFARFVIVLQLFSVRCWPLHSIKFARTKKQFYCVNTSYPMDNCFTGRRDRSRQTPEKDVLYIIPAGPVTSVHSLGGASYLLPV